MANRFVRSRKAGLLFMGLLATPLFASVVACGDDSDPGTTDHDQPDASLLPDGRPITSGNDATTNDDDSQGQTNPDDSSEPIDSPIVVNADSGPPGSPCGYKDLGQVLSVAPDIDICLPPVVCTPSENCPRGLGDCVSGKCVYKPGYAGLATLGEAWTTQYCDLTVGGCNGSVLDPLPYDVAKTIAKNVGPVCADQPGTTGTCVGISAPPPRMAGNSQIAIDPDTGKTVPLWGLGMTAASGVCYEITGDGGTAIVAITDRCAGYCKCGGGTYNECGNCINKPDTNTQCACVGTAPPLYTACCGRTCGGTGQCDWCANNNHPHFDLDNATFEHVCGPAGPMYGSCKLSKVKIVKDCYPARPNWPN